MNTFENQFAWLWRCIFCICVLTSGSAAQFNTAGELDEAALRGFPAMLDLQGKKLADGEFIQRLENDILHVTINYDFGGGHRIEEKATFRQKPRLVQETWFWNESKDGQVLRHFEVNFKSGKAVAEKRMKEETKRWSDDIKVEPARTFAGFGFTLAIKSVHDRLLKGEKLELQAVGFTPTPRVASVEISCGGLDQMTMANRLVKGDRFLVHPKIPVIARPFIHAKDTRIWLTPQPAIGFLRWEGALVELDDPIIRVDVLPGDQSGSAEPARP